MKNLLRIHLLGVPQVQYRDLQIGDFPAEKVKLLFCYLILFRHVEHSRAVLGSLFWGDHIEARARHSLSTALWRLRHWLEPVQTHSASFLLIEDQHIAFNLASAYWLDVAEFEERITWARQMNSSSPDQAAVALERAVELYRGELLEGCYADWCLTERNRLHQRFLQALLHLMVYHGGRGEYPQAIGLAQRILRDDPLREEIQRELIKLFVLDHQPAEALLQYRRCEAALREELGIEPMPETQDLFRNLILGRAAATKLSPIVGVADHDVRHQLKPLLQRAEAALKHFEAAEDELAQLLKVLRQISFGVGAPLDEEHKA